MDEREAAIELLQKEAEDLKAALAAAESRQRVSTEGEDAADASRSETELEKVGENGTGRRDRSLC